MKETQAVKQVLLDYLANESIEVIQTAYIYAKCYCKYGVNVTEKWQTATEQAFNLQRAYQDAYKDAFDDAKKNMPRWIPVNDMLPEEEGWYLAMVKWPDTEDYERSLIHYDAGCEKFGEFQNYYTDGGYSGEEFIEIENVLAWMPLPEPYGGNNAL